jgi:hypothetical protein
MKQHWSFAELLDLEYFISQDQQYSEGSGDRELTERDRAIYLQIKDSCQYNSPTAEKRCLLQAWVASRRASFVHGDGREKALPGKIFQELIRICGWGLFFIALLLGWSLAISFLSYSGRTPVNVSIFLALFVGSQVFFLFLLLFFLVFNRLTGRVSLPVTYSILRKIIFRLAVKLGHLSSATEAQRWLVTLFGRLRYQKKSYGLLFVLPFFLLMQLAGIGFNIGVLAATLFKVLTTDIAFGWQSTVQLSSEVVFHLVQIIALPWAWIVPARLAYPDLMQISGSQMVLKDGIYHLSTMNLVSWWPFLCLAVGVYGLLPRLFLCLAACMKGRSLLSGIKFNTAAQQQVLHRMLTPRLSTASRTEIPPVAAKDEPKPVEKISEPQISEQVVALIPDELFSECSEQELSALVLKKLGLGIDSCQRVDQDGEDEQQIFALWNEDPPKIDSLLLLQEAWQPPIEDFFYILRQLRLLLGPEVLFSILLIGKPGAETIFTEVREQDYTIWRQKIVALGDPYLQSVRLVD